MGHEHLDFTTEALPVQKIVTCTVEGIVEPSDLEQLFSATQMPVGGNTGDLKKIRERHHTLARHVASGMTQRMAATLIGFDETYVCTLLKAPAMMELVEYYRANALNATEAVSERLRVVGLEATERLAERLERDELDSQELLGLAKLGLDRSGHGPQSKVHSVTEHHVLDHAELQRLNRAARAESASDIIDIVAKALPTPGEEITGEGRDADA